MTPVIILTLILISLIFAPLGCISLWKKYIYFGDGLAHTSLLVGSINIVLHLSTIYSGLIVAVLFAILVFVLENTSASNTIISLVSSFMLSTALIINSMNPLHTNVTKLFVGDIMSVVFSDLVILSIIFMLVMFFIWNLYNQMILIIINREIAQIRGIWVKTIELAFLVLLSLSVFATIKIVGTLLVTSILLIPAMIARFISSTPLFMIINSVIIALIVNFLSLVVFSRLNIPITPVIIIISTITYCIFYIISSIKKRKLVFKASFKS